MHARTHNGFWIFALSLLLSALPGSLHAQLGSDRVAPDPERLYIPLGDGLYVGLIGESRGLIQTSTPTSRISSTEAPEVREVSIDSSRALVRLQPSLNWAPGGAFRLLKLAMDLQYSTRLSDTASPLFDADPWTLDEQQLGELNLTQSYGLLVHERYALLAGLVRPQFGLGLAANGGGQHRPHSVRASPYGIGRAGDRVLRAQVSWMPAPAGKRDSTMNGHWESDAVIPLGLSVATDRVYVDDNARSTEGDDARQYSVGVRVEINNMLATLAALYRQQTHAEGGETAVRSLLGHLDSAWSIPHGGTTASVWLEGEIALIDGHSSYSRSAVRGGDLEILSMGGAVRAGITHRAYELVTELGYASGDDSAFDREGHNFRFDKNYRVGALMFAQESRVATAISASNIQDPTFRARPPRGYDTIATGGAIENAVYINPRAVIRFADWGSINLGYLYGQTVAPWNDPYRSGLNGGAPSSPSGEIDTYGLGHELTGGVELTYRVARMDLHLRNWVAWYQPGDIFRTPDGDDPADRVGAWTSMEVKW